MAVFSDLPRELVMNILVRLMCVAKPSHSLIADPAFIALHLKHGRGDANSYLTRIPEEFSRNKRFCMLMYDQNMSVKHFIKREIPFRKHSGTDYYAANNSIVSFEMAERAFKTIELPDECFGHFADRGSLPDDWTPGVFQESLALVVHGGADDYIWIIIHERVWGMKIRPLGFTKKGELLLDDDGDIGELISFDLETLRNLDFLEELIHTMWFLSWRAYVYFSKLKMRPWG
ncbi:hypothetical protein CJ030_MR4G028689 [Morella rubra]|uniref:F-box domain-containing protein n=1 Tax=Morella rubra TaxID=262757 RepID=A0A6A1VTA4_9ROSI|nr:hypothetical protein CJ030_MR4G028689 [Morella rubra]